MKILVLSDTHGELSRARRVCKKLSDVDLIIHCGDYKWDGEILGRETGINTVAVTGNSDNKNGVENSIVETPHGKIIVTHGNKEAVYSTHERVIKLAKENDCFAVCFGHTHRPLCVEEEGIWLINPGGLTEPRDGTNGSYAVINVNSDKFNVNIIYDNIEKDKKVEGGFLRKLLNYSDRF